MTLEEMFQQGFFELMEERQKALHLAEATIGDLRREVERLRIKNELLVQLLKEGTLEAIRHTIATAEDWLKKAKEAQPE